MMQAADQVSHSQSSGQHDCDRILCYYKNVTNQIQVIRVANIAWRFEKVFFPGEQCLFESAIEAVLEVSSVVAGSTFIETINCVSLQVDEVTVTLT